jgi:hypothetical protein
VQFSVLFSFLQDDDERERKKKKKKRKAKKNFDMIQ